jgi:exopolysaccharide biosynthesis predicted pyruvyltransferase EpsI
MNATGTSETTRCHISEDRIFKTHSSFPLVLFYTTSSHDRLCLPSDRFGRLRPTKYATCISVSIHPNQREPTGTEWPRSVARASDKQCSPLLTLQCQQYEQSCTDTSNNDCVTPSFLCFQCITRVQKHNGTNNTSTRTQWNQQHEYKNTMEQTTRVQEHNGTNNTSTRTQGNKQHDYKSTMEQTTRLQEHNGTNNTSTRTQWNQQHEYKNTMEQTTRLQEHNGTNNTITRTQWNKQHEYKNTMEPTTRVQEHNGTNNTSTRTQ